MTDNPEAPDGQICAWCQKTLPAADSGWPFNGFCDAECALREHFRVYDRYMRRVAHPTMLDETSRALNEVCNGFRWWKAR